MVKRRCKFCLRKLVNGNALGGHMRSHTLNQSVSHFLSSSHSRHKSATHDKGEFLVAEPTGSSSLVSLQRRGSEAESFRKNIHPFRKQRSKRIRRIPISPAPIDYHYLGRQQRQHYAWGCGKSSSVNVKPDLPIRSIAKITSEEDLALALGGHKKSHVRLE
uniref:C2H2-type domain-containing protein n=1 Tax=Chenopodium quinoa TaxID=63459 RepID=A0A803MLQ4_CHEQI